MTKFAPLKRIVLCLASLGLSAMPSIAQEQTSTDIPPAKPQTSGQPVGGTLDEGSFRLSKASYSGTTLCLYAPDQMLKIMYGRMVPRNIYIKITFPTRQDWAGKYFAFDTRNSHVEGAPVVTLQAMRNGTLYRSSMSGFIMKLKFYTPKNGQLPGYIALQGAGGTVVKVVGYFNAKPDNSIDSDWGR
jgi:hypothetical protein